MITRRELLASTTNGIGTVALAWLLQHENLLQAEPVKPELQRKSFDLAAKPPHFEPKAKAMISLFMQGGPSHIDLFDPKPALKKLDGQPFPGTIKYDNAAEATSKVFSSPWKFKKYGRCGADLSELLPCLAEIIDDVTIIRSMYTGVNNHEQSIYALSSGHTRNGNPVLGSWLTYGLGSMSRNLPAFVALTDPASPPVAGSDHWSNGWLPSIYQGTVVRAREPRILNLDPPAHLRGAPQENMLQFLGQINRRHLAAHPAETDLDARIASYELAARMQTAAKEALDISSETLATQRLYGLEDPDTKEYGTRCLIARRLIERGVRFVQVFTANQYWDHHREIKRLLPASCRKTDRPSAALVKDLKSRGLLDSTVVQWTGEMGRLPVVQNEKGAGRDHNTYGFSAWYAGGGFKGGCVHGETDEFGHHAIRDIVNHHDLHATLLHLFGVNPTKLTYKRNGQELSLLDGKPGAIVQKLLA